MVYVVVLATVTAISGFLFGFDTAVINGVLLLLRRQFALSNLQTEIAASSLLLGCLLGAAGASMIGDRYGRKKSLIFSADLVCCLARWAPLPPTRLRFSPWRGWWADWLSALLQFSPLFTSRKFHLQKSGNAGLAESARDRARNSLRLSHQLATVEDGRSELAVDAGRGSRSQPWLSSSACWPFPRVLAGC